MALNKPIAFVLSSFIAASAFAADMPVEKLYRSYEKANQDSLEMPEYNKAFTVSGIVLERMESVVGGNLIISLGTNGSDDEMARVTFSDKADAKKVAALQSGAKFRALCTVGFNMSAGHVTLQDCVMK